MSNVVRIIVESPDTGRVARDLTCHVMGAARIMRRMASLYPYHTVRKLDARAYAGVGNLEGRRVPAVTVRD